MQGADLGAAVGPVVGYALLESGLPASSVLAAQSIVHGAAALVAVSTARHRPSAAADAAAGDRQQLAPAAVSCSSDVEVAADEGGPCPDPRTERT